MTTEQRRPTMKRMRMTSRTRREATTETTPAKVEWKGKEKGDAERYAGAFARVRLVRAWIAAVAAIASMLSPYVALLERLLKWWSTFHGRRAPRLAAVLAVSCALGGMAPARMLAHGSGAREAGRPPDRATPARFIAVTITHSGNGSASVYTNASGSTSFTVTNTGATGTALFSVTDCTGAISNCAVSPAASYLQAGWSTGVTVSFTGGVSPGSGSFTLKAHDQSNSSLLATYTVSVTVTADPNAPTVSLTPHVGDRRDVGMCVADCFESTLSYTLPAYTSLDVPRSVTMLYRSGSAYPHGKVSLDVTAANAPSGSTFRLRLRDSAGTYIAFKNQSTSLFFARNASGATRIVAEFDATQIPTSARLYTAEVSTIKSDGTLFGTSLALVRIIVLNDRNSPFGAGVRVVGIQRMVATTGGMLVTDGSGSAAFFAGDCPNVNVACAFTSPAGEFSTLATASGFYKRTYPDGSSVWFYPGGHHRSSQDRFGSATYIDYTYNGSYSDYVPTAVTDPAGQSITFQYRNVDWLYGWKQGSLGNIHTPMGDAPIGIDTANNAQHWVELGGGTYRWRMTYGANNLLDTAFNKASAPFKHVYRYGATLAYTDAPAIKLAGDTIAQPRVTLRDAWAQLLDSAAAVKGTGTGNALVVPTESRASIIDPRGNITYLRLNRFGLADTVKAPLTNPAIAQYDSLTGQLKRSLSPTGDVVRYTWSGEKLTQTYDSTAGKTISIEYETSYSLPKRIYGDATPQWFTYDQTKAGWPLLTSKVGNSSATPTTYAFDQYGRPTSITDPSNHTTTYGYQTSGLRNLLSVTGPNGRSNTVGRDTWGRVVSSTDRDGHTTTSALDILNRPGWIAGALGGDTTRFQYDALNNVVVVTDAKGQVYTTQRNALSWATKHIDPSTTADTSAYDRGGNVVYVRTRAGREIRLAYDSLNRVTSKIGVGGADTVKYAYDVNARWIAARTVSGGVLVSTDTIYTDSVGRTTQEATHRPGVGPWAVKSVYQSDKPGRVSSTLYAGVNVHRWIEYWYDAEQRPSQVRLLSQNTSFGYNTDNLPSTIQFPSGLTETTSYTPSHVLSRRQYSVQAVQDSFDRAYRTDSLGRLVERANGSATKYQTFDYINDRLTYWTKWTQTGTPTCINLPGGWGYDCTGSTPQSQGTVASFYDLVHNPDAAGVQLDPGNRLRWYDGVSMVYDADGNLVKRTGAATDSLVWDDFGQLKTVRQGGTTIASFVYDGFGRRIKKVAGANTVHYIWDGNQVTAEANGSGTIQQTYTYYPGIDQLHSVTSGGQTYYASIEPASGDVNGLINGSTNAVVATYAYSPWGEIESSTQQVAGVNSLRWKGLIWDDETKLYYMRARYYDPKIRRFISEDPIGLQGGINQYAFGAGDPVNTVDPSGLIPIVFLPGMTAWGDAPAGSPWGDPSVPVGTISERTVESTLRKIAGRAGQGPEHGDPLNRSMGRRIDWSSCAADLGQVGWGLVNSAIGIGVLKVAKNFRALATVEKAWNDRKTVSSFVRNATLLPGATALKTDALARLATAGTHVPLPGRYGQAYSFAKSVPVLGTGLELGEAINSCPTNRWY